MTAPPTTTTAVFTVWFRPDGRHRWRKIGQAASEAEAWQVALDYEVAGDKTVSRGDRDISQEKRPR